MKNSTLLLCACIGLGYTTQARADYVPTSTTWTQISSTAPRSVSYNLNTVVNNGPQLTETREWVWAGNDAPVAYTTQLSFDVTLGEVYLGDTGGEYCSSKASGGFSATGTNGATNFSQVNKVWEFSPQASPLATLQSTLQGLARQTNRESLKPPT